MKNFSVIELDSAWGDLAASGTLLVVMAGFFFIPEWTHRVLFYFGCVPLLYYVIEKRAWRRILDEPVLLLGAAYLLHLYLVSLVLSDPSLVSALDLFRKGALVLLFSLALYELVRRQTVTVDGLFGAFALAGALTCLAAIAVFVLSSLGLVEGFTDNRLVGFGRADHPVLGGVLASAALLYFLAPPAPEQFSGTRMQVLRWLAALILATFVLLTGSRAALLGAAVAVGVLLVSTRRWGLVIALVTIAVGVIVAHLRFGAELDWLTIRGDSGRFAIWADALHAITDRPFLGNGLATESEFADTTGNFYKSAHNVFLNTLYQGGAVGLLLLLAPYAFVLARWRAVLNSHSLGFLFLLLVHGFVTAQFDFYSMFINLNVEWVMYWIPLVAITAELRVLSQEAAAFAPVRRLE